MRGTSPNKCVNGEEAEGNLIFDSTATLQFSLTCETGAGSWRLLDLGVILA